MFVIFVTETRGSIGQAEGLLQKIGIWASGW